MDEKNNPSVGDTSASGMSPTVRITPASARDYSKTIVLNLQGEKGLRTYIRIATSPRVKYDAAAAAEEARENLRRQGMNL